MDGLFWFSMGVIFSFSLVIIVRKIDIYLKYNIPFKDILELVNNNKLIFENRIGDVVYFKGYKNYTTIYNIRTKVISIHDSNKCILASMESDDIIPKAIVKEIDKQFKYDIYININTKNGFTYSNNSKVVYKKEDIKKTNYTEPNIKFVLEEDISVGDYTEDMKIESILDKLRKNGLQSLTIEEVDFIDNIENWRID